MSAEGLAVLAAQGVAHCSSLSELHLDNPDMLKGAEGNKACSALAMALPACLSFKTLSLQGEWQDKAWA